jgi:AcrR family transcriptional regulator
MAEAATKTRDGAATRARIEREALRLFATKGVDGATIRDLSQAVGVADAALYRYFGSKEALARDLFQRHYAALAGAIAEIGAQDLSFARSVAQIVAHVCQLFDEEPDAFAFVLLNQHAYLRYVREDANAVAEVLRIVRRAQARGEIVAQDAELAAAMALGAALQPAVFKLYGRLPGPLEPRAPALARAALAAAGAA